MFRGLTTMRNQMFRGLTTIRNQMFRGLTTIRNQTFRGLTIMRSRMPRGLTIIRNQMFRASVALNPVNKVPQELRPIHPWAHLLPQQRVLPLQLVRGLQNLALQQAHLQALGPRSFSHALAAELRGLKLKGTAWAISECLRTRMVIPLST